MEIHHSLNVTHCQHTGNSDGNCRGPHASTIHSLHCIIFYDNISRDRTIVSVPHHCTTMVKKSCWLQPTMAAEGKYCTMFSIWTSLLLAAFDQLWFFFFKLNFLMIKLVSEIIPLQEIFPPFFFITWPHPWKQHQTWRNQLSLQSEWHW